MQLAQRQHHGGGGTHLGLILALSRNISQADISTKQGEWKRSKFVGVELYGKTLGVVGIGKIGGEVARRGARQGVATPINQALAVLVRALESRATGARGR